MLRKSRLAIVAFIVFFLQAVFLGAYVRCIESWPISSDHYEMADGGRGDPYSGAEVLRCSDDWRAFQLFQSQNLRSKDPGGNRVNEGTSQKFDSVVLSQPGLAICASRRLSRPLLSSFPYPSIAVYQSKVVYRL